VVPLYIILISNLSVASPSILYATLNCPIKAPISTLKVKTLASFLLTDLPQDNTLGGVGTGVVLEDKTYSSIYGSYPPNFCVVN